MDKLQTMLIDRYHPKDIVMFIKDNYKILTKNYLEDFNSSLKEPENEKPQRYENSINIGTMRYINKHTFTLEGMLQFYPQFVYNETGKTNTFINNKAYFGMNMKKRNIKLYRITACSIIVEGDLYYDSNLYENKKILYTPQSFDYKYINSFNDNEIPLEFYSKHSIITIYQHIEYVPQKKCSNCKLTRQQIKIHDDLLKNKQFEITDYDTTKFVSKVQKEYS